MNVCEQSKPCEEEGKILKCEMQKPGGNQIEWVIKSRDFVTRFK